LIIRGARLSLGIDLVHLDLKCIERIDYK